MTNEGTQEIGSLYSNIDYLAVPRLPDDALYFHAQYRQSAPCTPVTGADPKLNPDGEQNYVYMETRGRGHLMGVTLGVLQNANGWWGEGDDMIFVDDDSQPTIVGTGSEDYFLGSWDFGGRDGAVPFGHAMYGAPLIVNAERTGGRYCCYRWHGDNPVTFERSLKHTMEHGHANDRGDNFFSAAYWYQTTPFTEFPPLPPRGRSDSAGEDSVAGDGRRYTGSGMRDPKMQNAECRIDPASHTASRVRSRHYSDRSATIGLTCVARRAGTRPAMRPTTSSTATARPNEMVSITRRPNS